MLYKTYLYAAWMGFPGNSVGKESAYNTGDQFNSTQVSSWALGTVSECPLGGLFNATIFLHFGW